MQVNEASIDIGPIVIVFFFLFELLISHFIQNFISILPASSQYYRYDIHDIRSISYDSLRLARNQTTNEFSIWKENQNRVVESRNAATTKRPQEDLGDLTYWLYDAETSDGLFTEESLKAMYDTEGTIVRHPDYSDYCYLNYNGTSNVSLGCNPSLSVLNIFYASEWDQTVTEAIIDEFKSDPTKIETYNDLALCVEAKYFCDLVDPKYTAADKLWVEQIHETIMAVMMKWDGQGSLNSNINHVTEFIAYMNELSKSFSSLTLLFPIIVKIYSRSIHSSASIFSLPMHRCSLKERIILCEAHGDHDNRNTYSRNRGVPSYVGFYQTYLK